MRLCLPHGLLRWYTQRTKERCRAIRTTPLVVFPNNKLPGPAHPRPSTRDIKQCVYKGYPLSNNDHDSRISEATDLRLRRFQSYSRLRPCTWNIKE